MRPMDNFLLVVVPLMRSAMTKSRSFVLVPHLGTVVKLCILMHKCLNNCVPCYLAESIRPLSDDPQEVSAVVIEIR